MPVDARRLFEGLEIGTFRAVQLDHCWREVHLSTVPPAVQDAVEVSWRVAIGVRTSRRPGGGERRQISCQTALLAPSSTPELPTGDAATLVSNSGRMGHTLGRLSGASPAVDGCPRVDNSGV